MSLESSTSQPPLIRTIGWVGLVLSVAAAAAGGVWTSVAKPEHVWTEQQAQEFKAASEALHQAITDDPHAGHRHAGGEASGGDRAVAEARFAEIRADLESAQYARDRAGVLLLQLGLGGAACCAALLMLTSRQ